MKTKLVITDQTNQRISLPAYPQKIISLVPSISFLLYSLGLNDKVTGITRFCKYPENWKKQKSIIGGTKNVKYKRIVALQPDLILANKEENTKEIVEKLSQTAPVYVSDVHNLSDNRQFITDIGTLTQTETESAEINRKIDFLNDKLQELVTKTYKTVYFIWREPWMSVGRDTFINHMMQHAGFENLLQQEKRYPAVELSRLEKLQPEVILLSSEPYPFKEKHRKELQERFPETKILLVKGEPFTWFGSYPLFGLPYLYQLYQKLN